MTTNRPLEKSAVSEPTSALAWAAAVYATVDVPDARLQDRLVETAASLA